MSRSYHATYTAAERFERSRRGRIARGRRQSTRHAIVASALKEF